MLVTYEDGHWSAPYYDCGGGDIWMITYTVPFLGSYENGSYYFKGTSGLDIDLRSIDINQCPEDPDEDKSNNKEKNIFAGSDKCNNDTQVCQFIPDQGFRRGSYHCVCRKGFYFPSPADPGENYYNGSSIEAEYDRLLAGNTTRYYEMICKPCGPGCDECVDGRSCRYAHNWTVRTVLLIIQCITIGCTLPLFVFTIYNREVKVVKAASPVLLRIILLGSLFLYCPVLVSYYEPTVATCMLLQWFKEVGFSILFGAVLLKTWRISVVFRVRSAARVRITDIDLIKRLGLIVFIAIFYLIVRTAIAPPKVETGISLSNLKAEQCSYDWWDYAANIAELLLLLWGVRLCYVVRKAPSEFNESRFISWAIYNETMLSLFLCVATFFLQDLANPDLLYIIWFLYGQLTTTVVLALLFGSKIYLVSQGKGDKTESRVKTATTAFRQRTWDNSLSSQGLMAKTSSSEMEKPLNQKDIEDELKRLYTQLEQLKTRNMVVGNPHLTRKLTEMAEVARETEQMLMDSDVPNINGVHEISYSCNNNGRTSNSQADWI
ncbi:probable G-protein coupled receptor CG31760 [Patiria miniata]|uniref:G-protein coupled receptors family 3 profile domain-containing protein n=1 Tax=Patiria miniata TaxID=46514 RepID=A0A914AZ37_PATMI|nr:probable G-protein coupled receptor CG31760 [Patiria miniata]